ncbi:ABC transporter ATP-binding protein [Xanthobacter wiegelii]|uniref:ABC transporter ATP-binding protein n=1 Tax=Xanthobacter wiegelii TaxID=3119913 RepID=UPI001444A2C5
MVPALSVQGVEKRFGAIVAASGLCVDVPPGQKVSLIGANGAGKTTFVNLVTGYLKPDQGQIRLEGQDITRSGPRQITRLGICRSFQIPQLCVELTALENMIAAVAAAAPTMSFWRHAERDHVERARELLARFDLQPHADRPVKVLPGGVRKLLDIAMALARHPKVLLLDEPTSGVAAEEKFATMDRVMAAVGREAATILFVEHDMDIVAGYADRVLAFYAGRIIGDGRPDEVLASADVKRYVTGEAR